MEVGLLEMTKGRDSDSRAAALFERHARPMARVAIALLLAALPLVGLVSLLLRSELDPHFENYRAHFVVFGIVGGVAFILGYTAGEAAKRRGDARVFLLSLAFMATGGFLGLHALGTPGILFSDELSGFQVAIPVGLLVSAVFAGASAFVDVRPEIGAQLIRRRALLRIAVLVAMNAECAVAHHLAAEEEVADVVEVVAEREVLVHGGDAELLRLGG